ncbi:hypothetical protein O3Q52_28685 [Streptomyces sp. ActVer]|uniref:hypothetical protein n=1 Tax=Streptomyces sp. ActVer TaxID=3014558 RepID=UPI0022B39E6D|nr:hypothetical protein [Streptomyces sp. ActVer]MCZ4512079.1 hypothetical protein [Streptomyces sp. ActVer]
MALMAESTSSANDVMSAVTTVGLLLAAAVIVYGFICRERTTPPQGSKSDASRTGPESRGLGMFLAGCATVVVGHIAGSAIRGTWEFESSLAIELLVYGSALQFLSPVFVQHEWTLTVRRVTVAGVVAISFLGSSASTYTGGILS